MDLMDANDTQQVQLDEQGGEIDGLDTRVGDLEEDEMEIRHDIEELFSNVGGLVTMKGMLSDDIIANTALIEALTMRVETNEGNIGDLQTAVGTNTDNIETNRVATMGNFTSIDSLFDDVGDLETAVDALEAAAVIEDYFFVNPDPIPFERSMNQRNLIDEFCVTADGFLILNLAVNYASTDLPNVPNVRTRLLINGDLKAVSFVFDS